MKMTLLNEDLRIHQKLDDEPNDVGGLSAREMKEKFDQAGLTIQKYLNETHLPEEEQALAKTLAQAKRYTDEKVVDVGSGDMAVAVYDTQKRRRDIYEYADEKAREVKADTSNLGFVFGGTSTMVVRSDSKTETRVVQEVELENVVDPRGIREEETGVLVAPQGSKAMVLFAHVSWAKQSLSRCYVRIKVNGEERLVREGPDLNTGAYVLETVLMPVALEGGDRVTVEVEARKGSNSIAEIKLKEIFVEFFL